MFPCIVYNTVLSQFQASSAADVAPTARGEYLGTQGLTTAYSAWPQRPPSTQPK